MSTSGGQPLRWGVLGTGAIAGDFANAVAASTTGSLRAVGSRRVETAHAFAQRHLVAASAGTYADVIDSPDVDAVYIATPHPDHAQWAVRAAEAGKHLLVEKPIGINGVEAEQVLAAAAANDVFLMEAFMYRCHPQTEALVALIADGSIGEVRMVDAAFGFAAPFDPTSRLFDPALGGGGILDVGCYTASMAILIAAVTGADLDTLAVTGGGVVGATGVDEWAGATVVFNTGLTTNLACGVSVLLANEVRVSGAEGAVTIARPWHPGTTSEMIITRPGAEPEVRTTQAQAPLFALEVDAVSRHLRERSPAPMPWSHTRATMAILDGWRASLGVVYPSERGGPQPVNVNV